jgi:hypothetical protein
VPTSCAPRETHEIAFACNAAATDRAATWLQKITVRGKTNNGSASRLIARNLTRDHFHRDVGPMISRWALLAGFALAGSTITSGQLIHVRMEGSLSVQHQVLPWLPVTDHSGPHAFTLDGTYDLSLPSSVNEYGPFSRSFYPDGKLAPQDLRLRFTGRDWQVPLRQIDQNSDGDLRLAYYDRFSSILAVIRFGHGAIVDIDRLIGPVFPTFAPGGGPVGDLQGFLVGTGRIDGVINTVQAKWYTPVPESQAYAAGSALLLMSVALWRARRVRAATVRASLIGVLSPSTRRRPMGNTRARYRPAQASGNT